MDALNHSPEVSQPWAQILANAVHDMRTPLSAMRVTLEVLRITTSDTEGSSKLVGMLDNQVNELAEMLEILVKNPGAYAAPSPGSSANR